MSGAETMLYSGLHTSLVHLTEKLKWMNGTMNKQLPIVLAAGFL